METGSKSELLKLVETVPALKAAPLSSASHPLEANRQTVTDKDLLPLVAFPIDGVPHGFKTLATKMSEAFHVTPEFTTTCMLTLMSAAIGNTIRISPKEGYELPPFLWSMVIARSGTGKSHPIKALMDAVERRQAEEFSMLEEFLSVSEGEDENEQAVRKAMHYWVADFTIEALAQVFVANRRGIIIYRDEIAGLVAGLNKYRKGDDKQVLLQVYDGNALKIERKSKGSSLYIGNTGAAIIGGIQPGVLPKVFNEQTLEEGLLPRFLLLNLPEKPVSFSMNALTQGMRDSWAKLVNWCYSIPLDFDTAGFVLPKILTLDKAALDIWVSFFNEIKELEPFLSKKAAPFASKLSGSYSLKLAGLLHCLKEFSKGTEPDQIPEQIDEETVATAIDMTRFFLGQAVHALGLYGNTGRVYDEYELRLIETLHKIKNQVKNGRIPLSVIVEEFNSTLPDRLRHSSEKVSQLLRRLWLSTERGTGGFSHLKWEDTKIQKLISDVCPFTVTSVKGGSEGSDG